LNDNNFVPLSNFDISNELAGEPGFQGVFSKDELPEQIKSEENGIINLASSRDEGTHWVCYYNHPRLEYVLYFDSYGLPPPIEIEKYLKTSKKEIQYNTGEIQKLNTVLCGVYCVYIIKELNKGREYYDVLYRNFDPFPTNENETFIRGVTLDYDLDNQ
jgi:hypothetical protein